VEPAQFLAKHSARIDAIHLRSVDPDGKRLPLGKGKPDLGQLASEIRRLGWAGWLINEPELRTSETALAAAQIQADREYIRAVFSV
jgi:sugar phosphate isomerase/epimerase